METKGTLKGKCSSKQKGGEMDVSDVILGVQGGKPYEYVYYEDNDDYDYEAAERDGEVADEDGHMSDKYKKSTHPYYSTESTEHAGQYLGGKWVYPEDSSSWRYDNGNPVFVPSEFNKEVIWDRYHMSPEAFYAMYSDVTRDKVLLPEFQMAGENNINKNKDFLLDDFYYVSSKHNNIPFRRYEQVYNNTPISYDEAENNITGGTYLRDKKRIVLPTELPEEYKGLDVLPHEFSHVFYDQLFKNKFKRVAPKRYRKDLLEAYPNYAGSYFSWSDPTGYSEQLATNRELRGKISKANNNATGKQLDDIIDNMTDEQLFDMLNLNKSGYVQPEAYYDNSNLKFDTLSEHGKQAPWMFPFISKFMSENEDIDKQYRNYIDEMQAGNLKHFYNQLQTEDQKKRFKMYIDRHLGGFDKLNQERFKAMRSALKNVAYNPYRMSYENLVQGGKESKVPLNTPYVFSEKAPEGYYPTVENEEGTYSPLVVEPTVTVQASPAPYSKGWYALRPNKYNPYLPLEQQSKDAQADYIAQNTREATAKAAPYVAGTLLATAALPYAVSSGIGLAKGVGDFGSFLATTAGRQAAANTGKRLLFDTALGMGAWNASNDVSQDITGKSLDSHISEGMQYMGVPEGVADVASSFINPFGYLGAGAMEGAAKNLPYMIDRTKNVLSKTWNNPDSKFLHNVFPSRAIKLLEKEESKTNELYKSIAETQKNAREKLHELDESLRHKTANLESDEERGILFKQLFHADSGRNLKFEEQVPIEKHFKGSKEEPLSYTDLNGNEIKANAVLRTGNGELKTDNNTLYVKDGKIQNENINTITTTDDRMNYFEPSSNDVQKAIYNDYQKISSDMGDSGVVGGSYALYSHGITGSPHDLEVYTTQSKLKNLEKSLGLNHTTTGAMVENYTSKYAENNPAHNVQVCIIDGNGKTSWGHNAESIYASLHPEEYFKLRESYSFNKLGKRITGDMKIEIPMSPDQLLQEMKNNPDALVKKVFIDNIVSGKGKHAQRIYEAALSQPKLINECISTINKSMFGRDLFISELYPSIDLTDIEANKELLNLIGYDEKYATDPEVMESVFKLFDTEATWGTAGASKISDKRWGNQIINSATSKHNAAGAGANMARSPIGGGEQYALEGLMTIRRFLLSHESNKINNVSDYLKQLKRLNAASEERVSNILTPKQIETFNHFMTKHNMPNYIGTLTKDNTAQQMFVKINNIQSELNNKFGDFDAASNELMNLYRELDLPFLYDASERNNYRSTRHIGLNKDILSGGYFGGLSRPIAYGTKNSALYRPSARLEGSQLRMENAHVYDVMDIFNPKTSTSSYGDMQLDDQLKSILEKKIKNAEDAVRKDYTQLLNKDLQIYPYYMTQDVLPSQKAREIGKTIENEYIPLELESRDLRRQLTSLNDKLYDFHQQKFVLGLNRDSNRSALGYVSGVSFGAAALIGGIYGLINYIDKDTKETAQRNQKVAEQENKWLKHLGIPFENIRDVRTELNAGYTKYNEGRRRGKWKPFPEWAEENSDFVNDILTKYRK